MSKEDDKEIAGTLRAFDRARKVGGGKTGFFVALSQDKELPSTDRQYFLRRATEREVNRWDLQTYLKAFFGVLGWALFEVTLLIMLLTPH